MDIPKGYEDYFQRSHGKLEVSGAEAFNSLEKRGQASVVKLCSKMSDNDFDGSGLSIPDRIEGIAKLYAGQLAEFQEIIESPGFRGVRNVIRDYGGSIVLLTPLHTLFVFGPPERDGRRYIQNTRLYRLDFLCDGERGRLLDDLVVRNEFRVDLTNDSCSSTVRRLAVNPYGLVPVLGGPYTLVERITDSMMPTKRI